MIGINVSPYYWFREGMEVTKIPEIQGITSDYSVESLGPDDMEQIEKLDKGGPIAFTDYLVVNDGTLNELKDKLENLKS